MDSVLASENAAAVSATISDAVEHRNAETKNYQRRKPQSAVTKSQVPIQQL